MCVYSYSDLEGFVCSSVVYVLVLKPGETETFKTGGEMNTYRQSHVAIM